MDAADRQLALKKISYGSLMRHIERTHPTHEISFEERVNED